MTEEKWLDCCNPRTMLSYLSGTGSVGNRISERQLRLFACACARQGWEHLDKDQFKACIQMAEAFADGQVANVDLLSVFALAWNTRISSCVADISGDDKYLTAATSACLTAVAMALDAAIDVTDSMASEFPALQQTDLLRDIAGNPFHPCVIQPQWLTPPVRDLTIVAYADTKADGSLDEECLAALSDALEEAGCDEESDDILLATRGVEGCNKCQGAGVLYTSQALSSRKACPRCGGEGLMKTRRRYRGFWVLDAIKRAMDRGAA